MFFDIYISFHTGRSVKGKFPSFIFFYSCLLLHVLLFIVILIIILPPTIWDFTTKLYSFYPHWSHRERNMSSEAPEKNILIFFFVSSAR